MPFLSPHALQYSPATLCLLDSKQAKAHEQQAQAKLPAHSLMARAGEALGRLTLAKFPHARHVLVACGPGNNGGDGFVAAGWLMARGVQVELFAADTVDSTEVNSDARWSRSEYAKSHQIHPLEANAMKQTLQKADVVIDALFGAGLTRPLASPWTDIIEAINSFGKPVIAADIPSGIHADTGVALGKAITADVTLAMLSLRPGHFTGDAKAHTGELWWHDLDIPSTVYPDSSSLLTGNFVTLPCISPTMHKGQRGTVGIIGGAVGMRGAPLLGARTALRLGAGRVHVGFIANAAHEHPPELDAGQPSLMCHAITNTVWPFEADTWLFGPGAGMSEDAKQVLNVLLAHTHDQALVIDADGLNLIAADMALAEALHLRTLPAVLTPHPLEAARLLNCKTNEVQANRVDAAHELAKRYHSVVVLKGAGTVIADPQGRCAINSTGGAWLATAGSGDVLAGAIVALLAQGIPPLEAAYTAVYIHTGHGEKTPNEHILSTVLPVLASEQADSMALFMQALMRHKQR